MLRRKAWKGAEILFVLGLRAVSRLTGRIPVRRTRDRQVLDQQILPVFQSDARFQRILFVGCDWYTRHYEGLFKGRDYWTLERDPSRARFGGRQHVTADLGDLGRHFQDASLDLIICNGVIGWGLNDPASIETAMDACVRALSPGGALVIGWNDIPEKRPIGLSEIKGLQGLVSFPHPLDKEIETGTYNHHKFRVFRKPPTAMR